MSQAPRNLPLTGRIRPQQDAHGKTGGALRRFLASDRAAITVDYLVLSLVAIVIAVGSTAVLRKSSEGLGQMIEDSLEQAEMGEVRFY